MTRLLAIGDIHLHPGPRQVDRLRSLDQIIAEGLALSSLGAWLIPGDIFHSRSSVEDRNEFAQRLQVMADRAVVLIAVGNHDAPGDLQIFGKLKAAYPVYVVDRPTCLRVQLATGEHATCFVLPYPNKHGLVSAGVAPGDVVPTAGELLDVIFMHAAGELEDARRRGDLTFMIGHANITGAIASNGQPQIGMEISVSRSHLDRLGPILKVFSHVHQPQEISGAYYIGSVCRLDYGEIETKRYLEIIVGRGDEMREGATDADGWLYDVVSRPIDVVPMFHIDGTLTRSGFQFARDEDSQLVSWTGCDVRVRYTYKASEKAVLDDSVVRALFAGALRLKIEPVAVPDRALRSQAVADAHSLADKLVAYALDAGVEASARVLTKLARLEHTDPVQLQADVQRALTLIETPEDDKQTEVAAETTFDEPTASAQPVLRVAS